MKIADKRNRNKMLKENKKNKLAKVHELYNSPNGPYKIVTFVTLSGTIDKVKNSLSWDSVVSPFYYKQKKTNFLFIDTTDLNEIKYCYICRASDIVVFIIGSNEVNNDKLTLIKKNLPSCIFLITDNKYKKIAHSVMKHNVPDKKITDLEHLLDNLCNLTITNTTVCKRPYLIPFSLCFENNHYILKGFMKKGLVSDTVVVNGRYEMKVVSVKADRTYLGSELNFKDVETEQFTVINNFNDNEMEVEEENEEEFDEVSVESFSDEASIESNHNPYPDLIDLYKDYRGIRDIATCDFTTDNYPSHYKDLVFFKDFKAVEKYIIERKSVIPDNQMVEITLDSQGHEVEDGIFVIFNNYEYENLLTMYNYVFNVKDKPLDSENILVDFGHKILEVKPTLTKEANQKVFKKEDELYNGVVSFIAPLMFNCPKMVAYFSNPLGLLSLDTYKFTGVSGFIQERKLYDDVVLAGIPEKVYKRSCIIKRMFHSKNEVLYFKNIRLYTKNGRSTGYIKKPIGVHGRFRAYFSSQLPPGGKIYMSLYKRVFLEGRKTN